MKNKKKIRYLLIAVFVLIILAIVGKRVGWFGKEQSYKVTTEKVERRTIVETITANGRIEPETEVTISPDVSGEIVELHVNEGDEVKEGTLLLKIKPDTYISMRDRTRAALNSTKANYANSKARLTQIEAQFIQTERSYNRSKQLWEQGAISESDYETALSSYQMAKADVEAAKQSVKSSEYTVKSAEASLKEAEENLMKTSLYAPMDGTISRLNIEKGERVVGTEMMSGTELLRIANLNRMEVKVEVNENDIVRVNLNDTAIIEIDAYLDHKFKGIVTEIANSANITGTTTDQVTNFDVKVLILYDSYKSLIPENNLNYYPFLPGMSSTVNIQSNTKTNVLSVPIQAVTIRIDTLSTENVSDNPDIDPDSEELKKIVVFKYFESEEIVKTQEVKTGIQDNRYIEILEGLTEEDEVVVAPYSAISKKLQDGSSIIKVEKSELFEEKK